MNLGACSITSAELWGAYWSLYLGWQLGHRKIILELDSKCAVLLISHQVLEAHVCSSLLKAIKELLSRDWNVEICHIYREANSCADRVAKHGHSCGVGFNYFSVLPDFMSLEFCADHMGHHCPRIFFFFLVRHCPRIIAV